jgi:hypothetical protein
VPRATTPLQYRLELIEGRAVSGRHRLEAAKQLGWKQIRANTYGEMTDDAAIQKLALKMVSHSIPDVIRLAIPKKNRMMDASVRWRRGLAVGVVFTLLVPGVRGVEGASRTR